MRLSRRPQQFHDKHFYLEIVRILSNKICSLRQLILVAVIAILFSYLGLKPASGGSAFSMRLSRTGSQRVAIAMPPLPFSGEAILRHFSEESLDILKNDLAESTYFTPLKDVDVMSQLAGIDGEKGYIDFPEWNDIGAEILLKGKVSANRETISIECELYDLHDRNRKFTIHGTGPLDSYREVIHCISDKIVWEIFGQKGISATKISFISRDKRGYKNVYISDYDGKNLRQITRDNSITLFPHWSPDGKKISYTTFKDGNPDLYLLELETGKGRYISAESGINSHASWSPDGKNMVLSMSIKGNPDIYCLNIKKGRKKRLTKTRSIDTSPEWSPDGHYIAFTSSRSGTPQIYIMDTRGWNLRRVTYDGNYNDQPAWSPDGTKLTYSSMSNGHFDIYMINLLTNQAMQLTESRGNDESSSWSPDGKRIAFSSDRNGLYQIFVMDVDGSNQHEIISLDGGGYDPAWSPYLN